MKRMDNKLKEIENLEIAAAMQAKGVEVEPFIAACLFLPWPFP